MRSTRLSDAATPAAGRTWHPGPHLLVVPGLVCCIEAQHKLAQLLLVADQPFQMQAAAGVQLIGQRVWQLCRQRLRQPRERCFLQVCPEALLYLRHEGLHAA